MDGVTTDEVIRILLETNYLECTMDSIMKKVQFHLEQRCLEVRKIGAILFSNPYGILGMTPQAKEIVQQLQASALK